MLFAPAKETKQAVPVVYHHDKIIAWFNQNLYNDVLWRQLNRTMDFSELPVEVRFLFETARRDRQANLFSRFGVFVAPSTIPGAGNGLFAMFRYKA